MELLINVLEQGFLFSIVAIGVYITYKILDFPDLSVDGSFPLGAAISASMIINGSNPFLSIICAFVGGAVAGSITAFLHVKLKISNLMSGILVMIGLYSINLMIMGKANIPLFGCENVFGMKIPPIIILGFILIVVKVLFDVFLKTKLGYLLIGVGDNEKLITSLGVSKNKVKVLGLSISNGLVAMAGGLTAQYGGFADVNMGTGVVVKGLACVIIGISIFKSVKFLNYSSFAILGTIIYYFAIQGALEFGLNPNYLKLLTAIVIVVSLSLNNVEFRKIMKRGK